ncbi:MAG: YihY/virulence factor BrkB family protein [Opitutus sp.]
MSRPTAASSSPRIRLSGAWARLVRIYQKEIWQSGTLRPASLKGACHAVLRVISITITVFIETRTASRAAALSFSSLLGLGPLLAIAMLVAGFALGGNDSQVVTNALHRILTFLAPQVRQYEAITLSPTEINRDAVNLISGVIDAAQSGSAGALGGLTLLFIVLLLFKSIEDAFNDIWGVRQGRSVLVRIVYYWTILTLGAVLFFTAVAMLGAGTMLNVFVDKLPLGGTLRSLTWTLPAFSFALLTGILILFYRVIPNTHVAWRAAFAGGLVVAVLIMLNQYAAFVYVKRVVLEKSLYGSLAILPILMFGLYIFWLVVLIGGIVSYAVQNMHFRCSQAAWSTLPDSMRERLALAVFLAICRRFRESLPPISASDLGTMLKVPTQLLNECLNRLVEIGLIATLRQTSESSSTDDFYQPARPLNRITLLDFKTLDDSHGESSIFLSLEDLDPLIPRYDLALNSLGEHEFFQKSLEELLGEKPC